MACLKRYSKPYSNIIMNFVKKSLSTITIKWIQSCFLLGSLNLFAQFEFRLALEKSKQLDRQHDDLKQEYTNAYLSEHAVDSHSISYGNEGSVICMNKGQSPQCMFTTQICKHQLNSYGLYDFKNQSHEGRIVGFYTQRERMAKIKKFKSKMLGHTRTRTQLIGRSKVARAKVRKNGRFCSKGDSAEVEAECKFTDEGFYGVMADEDVIERNRLMDKFYRDSDLNSLVKIAIQQDDKVVDMRQRTSLETITLAYLMHQTLQLTVSESPHSSLSNSFSKNPSI